VNSSPIPIKIFCVCGQKYAFEVWPENGRMPQPVACPVCQRDGTVVANHIIARALGAKTQVLPPASVNALINSVQSTVAPHLVQALRDAIVQELAAQRRELLSAQQAATEELTDLARRLESTQSPLIERLRAYEERVTELEKELAEQSRENRELLKIKIDALKGQIETERSTNRLKFLN
jgi:hypothetical protein